MIILKAIVNNCFYFIQSLVFWFGLGLFFINIVNGDDDNGCKLTVNLGIESAQLDLLSFLRQNNLFGERFSYEGVNSQFLYEFVICGPVIPVRKDVTLMRKDKNQNQNVAIGLRDGISIWGVKGEWIMMKFGPGDVDPTSNTCKNTSLSSTVMLMCDRDYSSGDFKLVYKDEEYCTFLFELRMAAICADAPRMSAWFVLFIICLVVFLCYLIGGVLYLRFQRGAKGIEQIPHRQVWFSIGNKLADGCSAVCRCDQYFSDPIEQMDSHSPYSGGYSPIGEATPAMISSHNTQRDAPLLNP